MKKLTRMLTLAVALAVVLSIASQVQAQANNWNAVKAKIQGAQSYKLNYDYSGERGNIKFDYAFVNAGPKIRTEVLRGSDRNVGTVIVFDPGFATDKVRAKIGMGTITRALTHKDVQNTPFYQSIYGMILNELNTYPTVKVVGTESVRGQQATVYEFTGKSALTYKVWANANNEIIKTEKKQGGKVIETREFRNIQWNCDPKVSF